MKIKNTGKTEYFTAADGCKITELYGIPTEGLREASVAFAILPTEQATASHQHNFLEWYVITKGSAVMRINDEAREVGAGDTVFISRNNWHTIRNTGNGDLEFYCFCVPAFNLEGTKMEDESEVKESVERDFG